MRLFLILKKLIPSRHHHGRKHMTSSGNRNLSKLWHDIMIGLLLLICVTGTFIKSETEITTSKSPLAHLRLIVPPSHIALSGDLHIQIAGHAAETLPQNLILDILRQEDDINVQLLTTLQVLPDARAFNSNVTTLKLPCGLFSRGGPYVLRLTVRQPINQNNTTDVEEEIGISKELDVRWPSPRLSLTPEHVQTYPEQPVTAILEFPEVICPPVSEKVPSAIPEFWLELHFCGPSLMTCNERTVPSYTDGGSARANLTNTPSTSTQILYSEQVRGFPGRRVVSLRCEYFGLAGHYALVLRPTSTVMPSVTSTAVYLKAEWSEQFVFNVHARSIFPCDSFGGGVPVLFQYPSCILQTGDRIRLYAKLRADVASLAPPTSLEYVVEQRFSRGQHTLYFDCDLFVERYVEYCFVYVSQAITGAVADVRMDCVPTLPVSESETGGWGKWSEWTPCTTTCVGGTRNRHRFCDSPPPRYGAKFCEGPAVETEKCGHGNGATDWECMYGGGNSVNGDVPADRPEVKAEIGPGCRCGCVVHLGQSKPRRLLATSSQSCPGRTFWLIQADHDHVIRFKVDHFRLPCGSQWLKVRDGSSLSARLVAQLVGTPFKSPPAVISTGPYLLLEFFSDELMAAGEICGGGFLAHAQQILSANASGVIPIAQGAILMASMPQSGIKLSTVHIVALIFVSVVFIVSTALIAQYILRYRKYQIAEDLDSFADLSGSESNTNLAIPVRTSSSSTLLSEVISLTRLRPRMKPNNKHIRLRESSGECEAVLAGEGVIDEGDSDTQIEDNDSVGSTTTLQQTETTKVLISPTPPMVHQKSSTTSIDQKIELATNTALPESPKSSPLKRSSTFSSPQSSPSRNSGKHKCNVNSASANISPQSGSTNGQDSLGSSIADIHDKRFMMIRRHSNVSNVLTNGCYSPALSTISRATIRTTSNPKENKEKRNRERLLAGPGSEFSLANPDMDLEMDYYDYNVVNAGAAPGSYLGMDPAFLVWIPPIDDSGEILGEMELQQKNYIDLRPHQYVSPGSNTESPENELILPPKFEMKTNSNVEIKRKVTNQKHKDNISSSSKESLSVSVEFKKDFIKGLKENKEKEVVNREVKRKVLEDEIKFVDDDDEDECVGVVETTKGKMFASTTYHDTNILSN